MSIVTVSLNAIMRIYVSTQTDQAKIVNVDTMQQDKDIALWHPQENNPNLIHMRLLWLRLITIHATLATEVVCAPKLLMSDSLYKLLMHIKNQLQVTNMLMQYHVWLFPLLVSYNLLFSVYKQAASEFAGEFGFGSVNKD